MTRTLVCYQIDIASQRVEKEIRKIDRQDREKVIASIQKLGQNPRPHGYTKLDGIHHRVRVGNYRIIYAILDDERKLVIHRVRRRSESTYRNL